MRARAIETGCFVFAPAQVGTHKGSNRKTYGHSVVVAPWGEVLADAGGEKAGFVVAEIDLGKVADARKMVPSLTHDRKYAAPVLHKARDRQGRRVGHGRRAAIRCTIAIFGSLIIRAS